MSVFITDGEMPDAVCQKIANLKKEATKYKSKDIKKSIQFLYEAQTFNDKYYIDLELHIRIAKYLTLDKRFDEAFKFLRNTSNALTPNLKSNKFIYYLDMTRILDTNAYILFKKNEIKNALYYIVFSLGYSLVFFGLGGYPEIEEIQYADWYDNNSNTILKNIYKKINNQNIEDVITKMLRHIFCEYSNDINVCRNYYIKKQHDEINYEKEPIRIKNTMHKIENIPVVISEKINNEVLPLII